MAVVQSQGALVQAYPTWYMASAPVSADLYGLTYDYATLWRTQRNLRQVTSFVGRNFADVRMKIYERIDDTDRRAMSKSPQQELIDEPNPLTTGFDFFYSLIMDFLIYDRYYAWKIRNPVTKRLNLVRIPPAMIQPHGSWLAPERFELLGSKGPKMFEIDELLWQHGYSPTDGISSSSPIESLRDVLSEEMASLKDRREFWKNAARMSGVIKRPANARWSLEAKKVFEETVNASYGGKGPKAGGILILEDGMEFEPTSFSARDSQFVEARQLTTQEVGSAYFVAPVFLGVLENANFSNVKELHKHLYQDTLGPWFTQFAQKWKQQVLPEFDLGIRHKQSYVEFNIAAKLAGSFEEQAGVLSTLTGRPIMTANEGRSKLNLPRLEEGDGLVIPLNVLIGGQASPRDSAPDEPNNGSDLPKSAVKETEISQKSFDELSPDIKGWYTKHVEVLTAFFNRQKNSVVSKLGAGQSVDKAWDSKRWDSELSNALSGLSLEMVQEIASEVAKSFSGEFEPAIAEAWILNNARISAENINTATKSRLADIDEDIVGGAKQLFEVAATSRAQQIAVSRVTTVGSFAREEGGKQAGALYKEWDVRSSRSRHPNLNGETVKIGEKFSNGASGPGDPSLPEDEAAGCTCRLIIKARR